MKEQDFSIPNEYSDITFISSDGKALYYSKYIISMSNCKYLQNLCIGPFSTVNVININVNSRLLNFILNTIFGMSRYLEDSEAEIFDEILEFSRMSCWHEMLRYNMKRDIAEKLKKYSYEIIDIYPKILQMESEFSKMLCKELKNIPLDGLNPKVIKHCDDGIELMPKYIKVNTPEFIASALRYYIPDYVFDNKKQYYIIMKALLNMPGIDANEFINKVRDEFD